ncbi:MAG: exonuclease domain-containing protein [Dehalococcoidales bacterium]|nr:exonuclease domain-containing protein [Dehalococcoidales bacterium]
MKIFVVDTETDNVKPQYANILEIGLASVDLSTGETELLWDTLVHPPGLEWWCDCWFMQHSRVDPEQVRSAPTMEEMKYGVEAYLSLWPVTAFNLHFDQQVLFRHGVKIPTTWPCLMLTTKDILKLPGRYGDYKYPKFSEAWQYFFPDEPFEEKHRAGHDALAEAKLALALYQRGYIRKK